MSQTDTYLDSPWKEIIEQYFVEFTAFFFPKLHAAINWERGYEFLDKELQQITREAETGRRIVDKLAKVWLKNGEDLRIYIHIEVQGHYEKYFARRMFSYYYRLHDRYPDRVVSLVILGDGRTDWRPKSYRHELMDCSVEFRFPIVKLLDYREQWQKLEQERNPFAVVVRAHLKAIETRRKPLDRLHWKITLVKALYDAGYNRQNIVDLLRFIDWVMVLPKDLENQFEDEMTTYEEEQKMPYIASFERRAMEKGMEKGLEQGLEQGLERGTLLGALKTAREGVIKILRARFQSVSKSMSERINKIDDLQLLQEMLTQSALTGSLAAFRQFIDEALKARGNAS